MKNTLPLFLDRLKDIIPKEHYDSVVKSFSSPRPLTARVNTIKARKEDIVRALEEQKINFKNVSWYDEAIVTEKISPRELEQTGLLEKGYLYIQSLSSMMPVMILDPHPGEHILDMCAAPGSKTTQMAALMQNQGSIIAMDSVKSRFYRLKTILSLLGAEMVMPKLGDSKRLRFEGEYFDKILVDAPCSAEGRIQFPNEESFAYWSPRKIKEMVNKQRGMLLTASRLLKPGGTLVYSTCTFAPEENEGVIDWLLRKTKGEMEVVTIALSQIQNYPAIMHWKKRKYDKQVERCLRILPNELYEGFFVAKLCKRNIA